MKKEKKKKGERKRVVVGYWVAVGVSRWKRKERKKKKSRSLASLGSLGEKAGSKKRSIREKEKKKNKKRKVARQRGEEEKKREDEGEKKSKKNILGVLGLGLGLVELGFKLGPRGLRLVGLGFLRLSLASWA